MKENENEGESERVEERAREWRRERESGGESERGKERARVKASRQAYWFVGDNEGKHD